MDRVHGRDIDMMANELREKVKKAMWLAGDRELVRDVRMTAYADAAIRIVLEAAVAEAEGTMWLKPNERTEYGHGSHSAAETIVSKIRDLLPQDKQEDAA